MYYDICTTLRYRTPTRTVVTANWDERQQIVWHKLLGGWLMVVAENSTVFQEVESSWRMQPWSWERSTGEWTMPPLTPDEYRTILCIEFWRWELCEA
jgi:hypothetical protein